MKIIKNLFLITTAIVVCHACQRELNFDNNSLAVGTIQTDNYGNCSPVNVSGIFIKDSLLSNKNFVDIKVDVVVPGLLVLKTDTINGYSFSASIIVTTGENSIRLFPTGTPLAGGIDNFTLNYGNSNAVFSVNVTSSTTADAIYSLGSSNDSCTGAIVSGQLFKDSVLTSANTLTVQVNVASIGNYKIVSLPNNGFSYLAYGTFTKTGNQNVTLEGNGKPINAGNTTVKLMAFMNDKNNCLINVTVNGSTGAGNTAEFTLNGTPNNCTNYVAAGNYEKGLPMSSTNAVSLLVNVTKTGTYTISTDTINGISFNNSGAFSSTGAQSIVLFGKGTPINNGTFTFKPKIPNSCSFIVSVGQATTINTDYFPLTLNSWWSYDVAGKTDTLFNQVYNTSVKVYGVAPYQVGMQYKLGGAIIDTGYYVKMNNTYIRWSLQDAYSFFVKYDKPNYVDNYFLQEGVANGTNFLSNALYEGFLQSHRAYLKYSFTFVDSTTNITVNGKNYSKVIHIKSTASWEVADLGMKGVTENDDYYYAKGIGLIKAVFTPTSLVPGAAPFEINIRNYQVN